MNRKSRPTEKVKPKGSHAIKVRSLDCHAIEASCVLVSGRSYPSAKDARKAASADVKQLREALKDTGHRLVSIKAHVERDRCASDQGGWMFHVTAEWRSKDPVDMRRSAFLRTVRKAEARPKLGGKQARSALRVRRTSILKGVFPSRRSK